MITPERFLVLCDGLGEHFAAFSALETQREQLAVDKAGRPWPALGARLQAQMQAYLALVTDFRTELVGDKDIDPELRDEVRAYLLDVGAFEFGRHSENESESEKEERAQARLTSEEIRQ